MSVENIHPCLEDHYPGICRLVAWIDDHQGWCRPDRRWHFSLLSSSPSEFDLPLFRSLVTRYARENVATVTVFLDTPSTQILDINEKTGVISALSSIGGLLGLFMGFTAMTLAELVYYALSLLCTTCLQVALNTSPGRRERRKANAERAMEERATKVVPLDVE